jgi:hypothetical protein
MVTTVHTFPSFPIFSLLSHQFPGKNFNLSHYSKKGHGFARMAVDGGSSERLAL